MKVFVAQIIAQSTFTAGKASQGTFRLCPASAFLGHTATSVEAQLWLCHVAHAGHNLAYLVAAVVATYAGEFSG
jgi:hypothetical protein